MNKIDDRELVAINAAEALAEHVLWGMSDRQGKPLIDHCRRVYAACYDLDLDQRLAAILHDVVEDSSVSVEAVRLIFGPRVADLVDTLSRRNLESYAEYIKRVGLQADAVPIKLADLRDNLDESRGGNFDGYEKLRARYLVALEYLTNTQEVC